MKHNIRISTTEALLINKALRLDMQNETDNQMATELIDKINGIVAFDLEDNRCVKCKHFNNSIINPKFAKERRCMAKGNDNFPRFTEANKKVCVKFERGK